jgi:histidyl-tRNA synthetase
VGWAAGVERLAMLLEEPAAARPDVVLVVENDAAHTEAVATLARLRRAGVSAELVATGSPKKRYDKALKLDPAETLTFAMDGDTVATRGRVLRGDTSRLAEVLA